MKLSALSREQVRSVDQLAIEHYHVPGIVLMENAGRGAAEIVNRIAPSGWAAILCGGGNNGGDGYVIARHLQLLGREARIFAIVTPDKLKGDAKTNAIIAQHADIPISAIGDTDDWATQISGATVIVDALLGTGARGALRGNYAQTVAIANDHPGLRVAIDIPSGVDCDTGKASNPAFRAAHTITFVASKIGFQRNNADEFVGVVHEVGIGAPRKLLEQYPQGNRD